MFPVALYPVGPAGKLLPALDGVVITHSTSLHWDAAGAALARGLVGDNGTIQPCCVLIPWQISVALGNSFPIPSLNLLSVSVKLGTKGPRIQ